MWTEDCSCSELLSEEMVKFNSQGLNYSYFSFTAIESFSNSLEWCAMCICWYGEGLGQGL